MTAPADDDDGAPHRPRTRERTIPPERSLTIALGALFVLTVVLLVAKSPRKPPPPRTAATASASSTDPATPPAEDRLERAIAELRARPEFEDDEHAKEMLSAMASAGPSDAGMLLPDGAVPPALGPNDPKSVRFGVVLVRYRGAQLAPAESPLRAAALERAHSLRVLAKNDFAAAVTAGDPGSMKDIGTVQRGDLEPAIEYELFHLPVGEVSEVVDAPRGFWIMRRIR
jgi:hypothetical protein